VNPYIDGKTAQGGPVWTPPLIGADEARAKVLSDEWPDWAEFEEATARTLRSEWLEGSPQFLRPASQAEHAAALQRRGKAPVPPSERLALLRFALILGLVIALVIVVFLALEHLGATAQ
jgi:hypothetical protein